MDLDLGAAKQEVLDHLNFDQAGKETLAGVKIGATVGAAVGAAVAQIVSLGPVGAAAGSLYGTFIGGSIGFLHGLFTTDPAVTRRKAREWIAATFRAQKALDAMFSTWDPKARAAFSTTGAFRRLASAAVNPDRYLTDPLAILSNADVRDGFREVLRVATISPEHPQGITFGNEAIRAQLEARLNQRATLVAEGFREGMEDAKRPAIHVAPRRPAFFAGPLLGHRISAGTAWKIAPRAKRSPGAP